VGSSFLIPQYILSSSHLSEELFYACPHPLKGSMPGNSFDKKASLSFLVSLISKQNFFTPLRGWGQNQRDE
jgi:hypothetical protein